MAWAMHCVMQLTCLTAIAKGGDALLEDAADPGLFTAWRLLN